MAIRIKQPGATKAAATAGTAVGKAQRAEEDRARAEREQARADQEASARKARQTAMDWELQKMQITSQRAFERELRQEDYRLMAEDRAAAWQVEKMELTSRMDFEREEGDRIRETGQIDAKITALKKAEEDGLFTGREFEFESMMFNLEQQKFGIKNPKALPKADPMAQYLQSLVGGADQPAETPPTNPLPTQTQTATNPKTGEKLISHDGGKTWEPVEPDRVIPPASFEAFSRDREPGSLIRNAPFFRRGKK